jgi:hypothetical protein
MIPDNTANIIPIVKYRLIFPLYDMAIASVKSNIASQFSSLYGIPAAFEAGRHRTPEATRLYLFIAGVERLIAVDISFL